MNSFKRDGNNRVIFSPQMKIVELIDADHSLLALLARFDMQLPFGDVSVEQLCERYGVSAELFLMMCQVYSSAEYTPDVERLQGDDLKSLINYLKASHSLYLSEFLPSITDGFERLLERCEPKQRAIVGGFCRGYCEEVEAHLGYEELHLFPCAERLASGELCDEPFEVTHSMDEHADICDKIDDIKSILIKYLPESCTTRERYSVLCDVFRLSDDLAKHTLLELKILTPLALKIERRLSDAQM
ncbi:MAG: hemerythrin domain-containing protein [Alistipes sp.]|nr:hemerythrin domain-containing protein [Alistipes sp.]